MSFDSITNRGEFFSNHYLEAVLASDLGDLRSTWDAAEGRNEQTARSRLKGGAAAFFAARADANEASPSNADDALSRLHNVVIRLLGFEPDRTDLEFKQNTEYLLDVPVAARVETSTGLLLVAIEAGNSPAVDDLFDFDERQLHTGVQQPGQLRHRVFRNVDKRAVHAAADAVGEIYNTDEPPRYVLVLGGSVVLLAERAKWSEGRFLAVDLGLAFDRNDSSAKGELETIAALFSADALVPVDGHSALETLVDKSHKHAVGVSKELRTGIRESIEIIANEVIAQRDARARERNQKLFTRTDVDARDLTRQALRYLYRLIVLLYAESRPELGIVPADDQDYVDGYSLDRLRELCLVDLTDDHARNGSHFQQSLDRLFELVNGGYHADSAEQQLLFAGAHDASVDDRERRSTELYIQFPGLDAELFSPESTKLINEVPLRNEALQQVLRKLMLAPGKRRNDAAGFISYAQLGINQIGAVYEGLMAYTGFYAHTDLNEVAKGGDPTDGTWMLPVEDAGEYPDDVFVMTADEVTGRKKRVMHPQGSFVFRLSGRDRQRSASYYTPEVLTRCVVKHALAELLGLDDYAPEHGSSGITSAVEMLDLTIAEPALGSGAFANEAINQLSAEYLRRREAELGEVLNPSQRDIELQKVKAHFALHQTYGVDLNATAVELAEVSLWLNAMYPGLKAPWFGLQLRQGNSLIGCRRSTWTTSQLGDRPWANTKSGSVQPSADRPLTEPLKADEIHHFLLPGHGWAAVADRKEAKELRSDEVESLKVWRKQMLKAPTKADAKRLTALAAGVEAMWASAAERIRLTKRALRRDIDIYGAPSEKPGTSISRAEAIRVLTDPESALGRLRSLMDAWTGLWFWPLDTGMRPPNWGEWLTVAELLVRPDERHGMAGQLDLFDDLGALLDAERERQEGQLRQQQLQEQHPWLSVALDASRNEGAWHWELEFAPIFGAGGFDLIVGNPPWVRPTWDDRTARAESRPIDAIGTSSTKRPVVDERRYLEDLTSIGTTLEVVTSATVYPELAGQQANLYLNFIAVAWRTLGPRGTCGLVHQDTHMRDPDAVGFRVATYSHLRRRFNFRNELKLFEDVKNNTSFSANVYGVRKEEIKFVQLSWVFHPATIDGSFGDDGSGPEPGVKNQTGDWDARPHRNRIVLVDAEMIRAWSLVLDGSISQLLGGRAALPVGTADADSIGVFASQQRRLEGHYEWERGFEPGKAINEGWIADEQRVGALDEGFVVLAGHLEPATPFAQQPHIPFRSNRDYVMNSLESVSHDRKFSTNYSVLDSDRATRSLKSWRGGASNTFWRLAWRVRTDPGGVRSLQSAIIPPGPIHNHGVHTLCGVDNSATTLIAALWGSLPVEYLLRLMGKDNLQDEMVRSFPFPECQELLSPMLLRTARLNCLTESYGGLWQELYSTSWRDDSWAADRHTRTDLGEVTPIWSSTSPLRRDEDRWLALVELDALSALALGLSASQLCAMYRTQFAVLRKYEFKMVFDAEGRKICGYHQSAGYRQLQLQEQAKAGDLPAKWTNAWNLYEQYEADPGSVDWFGHYTAPFTRADRESAMTRAYNEFQRRLEAGEYGQT